MAERAEPSLLPIARINARAAQRLRGGSPWVMPADLLRPPPGPAGSVAVEDERGRPLGSALWSPGGRVALRRLCPEGRPLSPDLLRERLRAASARRRLLPGAPDAYRLVHGEADGLPGLFVDVYGEAVVLQTAAAAMDAQEGLIAELLRELLDARLVLARNDGSARDLEGLPRQRAILHGGPEARVRFHDAGALVEADLLEDSKTGSFLDQQENHALCYAYAKARFSAEGGDALDAFCYHGGFALQLARAGLRVLACDESAPAVARTQHNAALGGLAMEVVQRNAFDLLRSLEAAGRRFAVVVVDPPALAKRGREGADAMAAARRAYKELNLRALRLLQPNGLLFTCSCSGRVSAPLFGEILDEAARDVGRPVQLLQRRGAGVDHPVLLGLPESEYLKCWVLQTI